MDIKEISKDGLSHEFAVTITAVSLDEKIDLRLKSMSGDLRIPGFRPGKAPLGILRKRFRKNVLGEVLQELVDIATRQTFTEHNISPAGQPDIKIDDDYDPDAHMDLVLRINVDNTPSIDFKQINDITLDKAVISPDDDAVQSVLVDMTKQYRQTEVVKKKRAAAVGDITVIDYEGKVDDVAFEGGKGEAHYLELGSNQFIPGFEDQLVGAKAGDSLDVKVTFPEDYNAEHLKGKEALFHVTVQELREHVEAKLDDEFAKGFGLENMDDLKEKITEKLAAEYEEMTRSRTKRLLLDALSEAYDFEVPKRMVDQEFEGIWQEFMRAKEANELDESEAEEDEEKLKAEYSSIAERRVRLGLLLAEVGRTNDIQILDQEINQAIGQQMQRYPGQEQQIIKFYSENPQAKEQLKAPIYEDKVVNHLFSQVKLNEATMTLDDFNALDPDEDANSSEGGKKAKTKKAAAKKTTKKAAGKKTASKKVAAKK